MRKAVPWLALGAAVAAAGAALGAVGVPSSYLFAALLLAMAVALTRPGVLEVPSRVFVGAQAVTGVALGAYLQSSSLEVLADDWLPVALVSAATLLLSLLAGYVLARTTEVDDPTAALGMIAGGASGIVAMSGELGADDRLVAFMQYLRVLVVVLLTPVLAAVAFGADTGGGSGSGGATDPTLLGDPLDWLITAAAAVGGVWLGRLAHLPAASLLGPLFLAAAVTLGAPDLDFAVPELLQEIGFALIGLQVGLRFTTATIRAAGRLLVPVLVAIVGLMVACFGLALALDATTSVDLLDAYLATTPGGLYAVLAAAVGAGANTTFIVAVQSLRLLIMVLLAPVAVRAMLRLAGRRRAAR
ncbi:MAG TPA: AbrB family transcriptional regulator [Solirubrobacteraceae bacterium]|nr:AbrB family transcriptional regulator [Solirubrobacteraceae bacterium]